MKREWDQINEDGWYAAPKDREMDRKKGYRGAVDTFGCTIHVTESV